MRSVTILSTIRNIKGTIVPWLDSLLAQDYKGPVNIVIIDAESTDGTHEVLKSYAAEHRQLSFIVHKCTQPEAFNYAIDQKLLSGEYVALIDGDCVAPSTWLRSLVEAMDSNAVDAVGGPGLTPANVNLMQKVIGFDLDTRFLSTQKGPVMRHPNMNLLIKRSVLEEIRFDAKLIVAYDTDFGYRLNAKGYKLWYEPGILVYHYHRSSLKGYIKQQLVTGEYALKFYLKKMNSLKGDNINPMTMTLQPIFLGLLSLSLLLSFYNLLFLFLSLFFALGILALFTFDVARAFKINKNVLVLSLYILYTIRLTFWIAGAVLGLVKFVATPAAKT